MNKKANFITRGALVAALYTALTLLSAAFGLSGGPVQVRIAEALTVLPAFFGAAVPGLFVGCFAANLITGAPMWDCVAGAMVTLAAAYGTYKFGKKSAAVAAVFPIAANTIYVPIILKLVYKLPGAVWVFALGVFVGETISCGAMGTMLYKAMKKRT